MGIARPPPCRQHLAHVRLVISVGILQEQKVGHVGDDDPAAREGQRSGNVQTLGKHGYLVALTVAVGVFEDLDLVVADTVGRHLVRVVDRLSDPQATALVPGETDGVDDVRLAGEEFEPEADRRLSVIHAVLRRERKLVRQWL